MKKVLVLAGLAYAAYAVFGKKTTTTDDATATQSSVIGFNVDGTPRMLTDEEAKLYLQFNGDLMAAFGKDLEAAKQHWLSNGYLENRLFA